MQSCRYTFFRQQVSFADRYKAIGKLLAQQERSATEGTCKHLVTVVIGKIINERSKFELISTYLQHKAYSLAQRFWKLFGVESLEIS